MLRGGCARPLRCPPCRAAFIPCPLWGEHHDLPLSPDLGECPHRIVGHRQVASLQGTPRVWRDATRTWPGRYTLYLTCLFGDGRALNGTRITRLARRLEQFVGECTIRRIAAPAELPLFSHQRAPP